ncbi:MAG: hypothetical protein PHF31_15360 [Methylobacter sp.]|nr:hypothetical protein [Methylobacter sp.]
MDIALRVTVAGVAASSWQVEQRLQAIFALVCKGRMSTLLGQQIVQAGDEALERSREGFGCKIHALCDALGMPVKFIVTGGQEVECKASDPCWKTSRHQPFRQTRATTQTSCVGGLKGQGIKAVIPPK